MLEVEEDVGQYERWEEGRNVFSVYLARQERHLTQSTFASLYTYSLKVQSAQFLTT